MPPAVAAVIFVLGVVGLFLLERDRESRLSPALWIPVAWVLLAARALSDWLEPGRAMRSPDQYLEGSPLDRLVLTGLLAVALIVLLARGRRVAALLRLNWPILLFFLYCAVSVLWSDYPAVAFKRWTRALGDVVMVLVVLTDADASVAVKRFLERSSFLLIPISVLLVKYYPELGRAYNPFDGTPYYSGVATGKNGLGSVCLVFGLAALWRFLEALRDGERPRSARPLIAHGAVLAMALWLFWKADSATSLACFLVGVSVIGVTSLPGFARRPGVVHVVAGGMVFICFLGLFLGAEQFAIEALGRDTTLTGRTAIWDKALGMTEDPLFGTGFESFWLGERAQKFWSFYWGQPNQAHNGYLEIFLNLGWMGVVLLGLVMAWGYRNVAGAFREEAGAGKLKLAYFAVAAVYNLTEAAFKGMHPVWIAFLLAITVVPERREDG